MCAVLDLEHAYEQQTVLSLPHWVAAKGEQWLVLGPSGSGKTTLLHLLAGLVRPTRGSVQICGQLLPALSGSELDRFRGRHIGMVFQRLHLLSSLDVLDNLLLAGYLAGLPEDRGRALEVLDRLGLGGHATRMVRTLSQGEAQRVAIARALVNRPAVLLADEPTSSLDDASCDRVLDLLTEASADAGATLVVATHDRRVRERFEARLELTHQAGAPKRLRET